LVNGIFIKVEFEYKANIPCEQLMKVTKFSPVYSLHRLGKPLSKGETGGGDFPPDSGKGITLGIGRSLLAGDPATQRPTLGRHAWQGGGALPFLNHRSSCHIKRLWEIQNLPQSFYT
jgi:hypothetical protein